MKITCFFKFFFYLYSEVSNLEFTQHGWTSYHNKGKRAAHKTKLQHIVVVADLVTCPFCIFNRTLRTKQTAVINLTSRLCFLISFIQEIFNPKRVASPPLLFFRWIGVITSYTTEKSESTYLTPFANLFPPKALIS